MKKKTETILALEHAKKVCDPQPQFMDRQDVRELVAKAYRAGYRKGKQIESSIVAVNADEIKKPINRTCGECVNSVKKRTENNCDYGYMCSKNLIDVLLSDVACDNFKPLPF